MLPAVNYTNSLSGATILALFECDAVYFWKGLIS